MSKPIILMMPQRSDEWYQARRGVLTASACKDIMTPGYRKSFINKMIAETVTGQSEPFPVNDAMQWGIDNEDLARETYEKLTENKVDQIGFAYKDEDKRVGCSPDGLIGKGGLIEIKCPMTKTHVGYKRDINEAIKSYGMQMQFQMYVMGRVWCDFVSFDPRLPEGMNILVHRVERDPDAIMKIESSIKATLKEIDEFLDDHNYVRGA